MKKSFLILFSFLFLFSFSQEEKSLQDKLNELNFELSNKKRGKEIIDEIDKLILKNKRISTDTLNMSYGLFVDKLGEIFVTYNDINDVIADNTFENIFKRTTYRISPFKDSLRTKTINYNFKGINRYTKVDSIYKKVIPKKGEYEKFGNNLNKQEQVPRYVGCNKKLPNKEMRNCMMKKITKLIGRNFNVNLARKLKLTPGIKRIFVRFKINKKGIVTDIKARGPHKKLEKEAIRVMKLIPKMKKPGIQKGKPVKVRYNLPIVFKVEP